MRSFCLVLFLMLVCISSANALVGSKEATQVVIKIFSKAQDVLPESKIDELVDMIKKSGDVKTVRKVLGEKNLSKGAIEDAYMRIAFKQGKIGSKEADTMFKNLSGKDGFRTTLAKVVGVSDAVTKGHLSELRLANRAAEKGFDVVAIGQKFDDGIKGGATDIDVLLHKDSILIPIENKEYSNLVLSHMDMVRRDMDTLVEYKKHQNSKMLTIFRFSQKPSDSNVARSIELEAKRRGVNVVYGTSDDALIQIKQLVEIAGG